MEGQDWMEGYGCNDQEDHRVSFPLVSLLAGEEANGVQFQL